MIAIIDYGMGNLRSVQKALEYIGAQTQITSDPFAIERASRVILPGVGAYRDCSRMLKESGMADVTRTIIAQGKPLLGICVGMQLLFASSDEGGFFEGLDVFSDSITKLQTDQKIPHMGWNQVQAIDTPILLKGVAGENFYFVHSYAAHNVAAPYVAGMTDYGVSFVSCVQKENVMGTQFHPEKSGEAGLALLQNFLTI